MDRGREMDKGRQEDGESNEIQREGERWQDMGGRHGVRVWDGERWKESWKRDDQQGKKREIEGRK